MLEAFSRAAIVELQKYPPPRKKSGKKKSSYKRTFRLQKAWTVVPEKDRVRVTNDVTDIRKGTPYAHGVMKRGQQWSIHQGYWTDATTIYNAVWKKWKGKVAQAIFAK